MTVIKLLARIESDLDSLKQILIKDKFNLTDVDIVGMKEKDEYVKYPFSRMNVGQKWVVGGSVDIAKMKDALRKVRRRKGYKFAIKGDSVIRIE